MLETVNSLMSFNDSKIQLYQKDDSLLPLSCHSRSHKYMFILLFKKLLFYRKYGSSHKMEHVRMKIVVFFETTFKLDIFGKKELNGEASPKILDGS